MFAVIFVVQPKDGRQDDYLSLAKQLKPKLEAIDGFIDNERFKSRRDERRVLSLSTWRDEKAVVRWRSHGEHHGVQEKGRFEVFEDYRLRVGEVSADTDPPAGLSIVQQRIDATQAGDAKAVTVTELTPPETSHLRRASERLPDDLGLGPETAGLIDHEVFESIYHPGKLALLAAWRDEEAAKSWSPAAPRQTQLRHRQVRVIRDYGMHDRREAPQYYPDANKAARPSLRRTAAGR